MKSNRTGGNDLLSGEKVRYLGKVLPSYHFSMLPIFLLFEVLMLGGGIGVFLQGEIGGKLLFGLFFLAPFLLFVESGLAIRTTILAVTDQRVVARTMTLTQRISLAIPLDQIESVEVKQGIIGTMYGYGTVSVNGTGGRAASVPGIENPFEFEKIIHEALNERRS